MELFTDSITDLLSRLSIDPRVDYKTDFLIESPVSVKVSDVCKSVKDRVDLIIKAEKKKLMKIVGKDGNEDDLLNTSNLGMSLLTISDAHNMSELDIIEPETPRMLNDNLLDFDNQFMPTKDYKMKKLNLIEKAVDNRSFTRPKSPIMIDPKLSKGFQRKASNENFDTHGVQGEELKSKVGRQSIQPPSMIRNSPDLGSIQPIEKLGDAEFNLMTRISGGSVKRELPTNAALIKNDPKRTFGDFFVGKSRVITGEQSIIASDFFKKNHDKTFQHARGTSANSNGHSTDGRQRTENDFQSKEMKSKEKERSLKLAALRVSGQPDSIRMTDKSETLMDKGMKSFSTKQGPPSRDGVASPFKDSHTSDSKSMSLKSNLMPEMLLTARAREIMQTKMTHKSINSKYHNELFKIMDSKSKTYDFRDSQMGDGGAYFLAKYVKDNHEIDMLRLDNCKITDDGLSILLYAMIPIKIDKLYLRDNQITKDGVELIRKFIQMKKGLSQINLINLKGNPLEMSLMTAYIKEFSDRKVILVA